MSLITFFIQYRLFQSLKSQVVCQTSQIAIFLAAMLYFRFHPWLTQLPEEASPRLEYLFTIMGIYICSLHLHEAVH